MPENRLGITPAYAGKSSSVHSAQKSSRDHPRVCGEKTMACSILRPMRGSPPRVRGKDDEQENCNSYHGITPAHAGKSMGYGGQRLICEDHPRVCGEKAMLGRVQTTGLGSPPRMRGKVRDRDGSILSAKGTVFEVQKGHPVFHLRQRLQVWPDHARHLRHGLILHASRSAGQGRRLCPGPCPDTAGSGTPRGPSPAKRPHTSPPTATPGGCRAWQSGATAPGSR